MDLNPSEENLPELASPGNQTDVSFFDKEHILLSTGPSYSSFMASKKPNRIKPPLLDFNKQTLTHCNSLFGTPYHLDIPKHSINLDSSHELPQPDKDVGKTMIVKPTQITFQLASSKRKVLQNIQMVVGDKPTSDFKPQFAPQWIVRQPIATEKENYRRANAYQEVEWGQIPRSANIIFSHHFFKIKSDGEEGKLNLKFRSVPHGNGERDMYFVPKDSATVQFPIIRIVLSIAPIFSLSIASIDIIGAYLQAGTFPRDTYAKPPKGWASSSRILWKLLEPAYCIVESGRLWQLVAEE